MIHWSHIEKQVMLSSKKSLEFITNNVSTDIVKKAMAILLHYSFKFLFFVLCTIWQAKNHI